MSKTKQDLKRARDSALSRLQTERRVSARLRGEVATLTGDLAAAAKRAQEYQSIYDVDTTIKALSEKGAELIRKNNELKAALRRRGVVLDGDAAGGEAVDGSTAFAANEHIRRVAEAAGIKAIAYNNGAGSGWYLRIPLGEIARLREEIKTLEAWARGGLTELSDEQRLDLFSDFCAHCGRIEDPDETPCQCWLDE